MSSHPRTLLEAHASLTPPEQRAYIRYALRRMAWIVREKERETGLSLEDPGSYLAEAWNKLARPVDADQFIFRTKEDIANLLVHEATFQVLMGARRQRNDIKREIELLETHDTADDNTQSTEPADTKFAAEKIVRHIEAHSTTSGKSALAVKLIQLLRSDSAGVFIRCTAGSKNAPPHYVLQTAKIAEKLELSPNKISKISRFITEQAHVVGGSSYYQFLEAIASTDLADETGTA